MNIYLSVFSAKCQEGCVGREEKKANQLLEEKREKQEVISKRKTDIIESINAQLQASEPSSDSELDTVSESESPPELNVKGYPTMAQKVPKKHFLGMRKQTACLECQQLRQENIKLRHTISEMEKQLAPAKS